LEAGLIGTALVDVRAHISDALPAVVRPALRDLQGRGRDSATIDELRYLLHACTCLPSPGIKLDEVETLAMLTQRFVTGANFAKTAHLAVSWLQIRAPAKAKQHYLDALGATCARLIEFGEKPTHPAHPLLVPALSPALAGLLAREGQQNPPPITPPLVRDITGALVLITRGLLSQAQTRPAKGQALSFTDWVEIMRIVTDFCDEHGVSKTLPGWAAEALSFTVRRAHRPLAQDVAPNLETLHTMLRLLRHYKAKPAPDGDFFVWVAKQLASHHQPESDPVVFAEIVGDLVPQLPRSERAQFTQKLFSKAQAPQAIMTASGSQISRAPEVPTCTRQLLNDRVSSPKKNVASVVASSVSEPTAKARASTTADMRANPGARTRNLWGRLAPAEKRNMDWTEVLSTQHHQEDPSTANATPILSSTTPTMVPHDDYAEGEKEAPLASQQLVVDLQSRLEQALNRVEALEARLEEQSSGLRDDLEDLRSRTKATEAKVEKVEAAPQNKPSFEASVMPPLPDWTTAFPFPVEDSTLRQQASDRVSPGRATLHLRRPFDFEEFRRSQSQGLQNERLRVLVPPDPMNPLRK
jgi:hypothetical protein